MTRTYSAPSICVLLLFVFSVCVGCDELRPRCQSTADCLVNCDCADDATNVGYPCGVQYRCDLATDLCEEDITTAECESICELAETQQCYSARCDENTRCIRTAQCEVTVDGALSSFPCEREFSCDNNLCESDYTISDTDLCQRCFDED